MKSLNKYILLVFLVLMSEMNFAQNKERRNFYFHQMQVKTGVSKVSTWSFIESLVGKTPAFVFSVRKLSSTGPAHCIKLRRGSDNATKDI